MGGACRANGEIRHAYVILVGKPEEKRSLGRTRYSWKDNIKMGSRKFVGRFALNSFYPE
jgi:hypothetical protein